MLYGLHIEMLKKYAEEVAGEWNGDEAGIAEERASVARDVIEKCDELLPLVEEFNRLQQL